MNSGVGEVSNDNEFSHYNKKASQLRMNKTFVNLNNYQMGGKSLDQGSSIDSYGGY